MINPTEIRASLQSDEWIKDPFHILSLVSQICTSQVTQGREFVIRILEKRNLLSDEFKNIVDELAIQVGLFPYVESLDSLSLRSAISHASHRIDGVMEDYILHSSQAKVMRKLIAGESVVLSAPTSFGKSLLIDILISLKNFNNIVLIVPTLALVEETRRRMSRFIDKYTIITSNNQEINEKNIFVLTQERFMAMEAEIPCVDFFVIDEFYKLSICGEGDRATQLNQAFIRLFKTGAQFYMLGPSISSIPHIVEEKIGCNLLVENFHTVATEVHRLPIKPSKREALAKLLDGLDDQTMIYCQSPGSTRKVLKEFLESRSIPETENEELIEAADWTAKNYHDKWLVSIALRHGIGIHHGRLPRSLARFMVRAFEERKIKILLCTSTLIEGVNTIAKNVIVYDSTLNQKPLDFFTYNNIKGRSGRMLKHFMGHVYIFQDPPEEKLPLVDIPILNPTENTPSSLLLQIDRDDIPSHLRKKIDALVEQKFLPLEVLIKNSSIEPEYLIQTARHLFSLDLQQIMTLSWTSRPQYENIKATSSIIWDQMGGKNVARRSAMHSASMMTFWIWDLYKKRNISVFRKAMINNQIEHSSTPDDAVENVLSFLRNWASFNYPKYLAILSDISNHVLKERGLHGCNYLSFAAEFEHLFQPSSFTSLEEFGLPVEISQKLLDKRIFSRLDTIDSIMNSLRGRKLTQYAEDSFERGVIKDFQKGLGAKVHLLD